MCVCVCVYVCVCVCGQVRRFHSMHLSKGYLFNGELVSKLNFTKPPTLPPLHFGRLLDELKAHAGFALSSVSSAVKRNCIY